MTTTGFCLILRGKIRGNHYENNTQIHSAASVPPYRWCYLALSSFGLLFVGIIYAWSIFKVPLQDAFGWDAPSLAVNYSLSVAFLCIGGLVGGLLDKKLSTQKSSSFRCVSVLRGLYGYFQTGRFQHHPALPRLRYRSGKRHRYFL